MVALFNLFLDICLLRKGPQDVPASTALLQLSLALYAISGLVLLLATLDLISAFTLVTLDLGLLVGLTYGVLNLLGRGPRFAQTLTALAGTGVLLELIAWPLAMWIGQASIRQETAALPGLLYLVLLGWNIVIIGHILRHALSITLAFGVLYAFGYLLSFWVLSDWLVPATG
ncbi:MAG: hypothetical protein R3F37_01305 [Candidatus Competibacteraceae bacterium]